jgi:ADP-ribose pyrophosphatase YjhB (NUDIX family)
MTKSNEAEAPRIGMGIVLEHEGRILVGLRRGWLKGLYSIPGGLLHPGETFEEGTIREIQEETGLHVIEPRVIAITNNLETFRETGRHHISVILWSDQFRGEPRVMEPEKCAGWSWCDPRALPEPHLEGSRKGVECLLGGAFYRPG